MNLDTHDYLDFNTPFIRLVEVNQMMEHAKMMEVGEYTIYVIDKENSFWSFNGKKHCCVVIKGNGQYRVRTPFNDPESLGTIIDESIKKIIKYSETGDKIDDSVSST